MRGFPHLLTTCTLLLLALSPALAATAQNDAGLGRDAPNGSQSPFPVLAMGSYSGQALYSEGDMEDWYHVVAPCGLVVTFRATAGALYGGIYTTSGLVQNGFSSGSTVTLNAGRGAFNVGFGNAGGTGSASYAFTFAQAIHDGQNDAMSGCDAPDNGAVTVTSLGSFSGQAQYDNGDREDWYTLRVPACAGLRLDVSSTSGSFYVGIYGPGAVLLTQAYLTPGASTQLRALGLGEYSIGIGDAAGVGSATYSVTAARLQNDANSGCDASAAGANVGQGYFTGRLDYDLGDMEDWYNANTPRCALMEVTFTAHSGGAWFGAYTRDGDGLANIYLAGGESASFLILSSPMRLGIGDGSGYGIATYSFEIGVIRTLEPAACILPVGIQQ